MSRRGCRLVIARAPLRMSFVGGGSDLPGGVGATISAAIDKRVYCVAKWRLDQKVYLSWRKKEIKKEVKELEHDIIRECLLMTGIHRGIEILTFADVPGVGSGLGSSGATTVAVLTALYKLLGYDVTCHAWIAEKACEVELSRLKREGGPQDQFISAIGGLLKLGYEHGQVTSIKKMPFEGYQRQLLRDHFLLFSPGVSMPGRDADSVLRDFDNSEDFREGCVNLVRRFEEAYSQTKDWSWLGEMVHEHSLLKAKAFSPKSGPGYISGPVSRKLGQASKTFKICGAGSSGHLLVGCTPETREEVREKLEPLWGPELPYEFSPEGVEVLYCE